MIRHDKEYKFCVASRSLLPISSMECFADGLFNAARLVMSLSEHCSSLRELAERNCSLHTKQLLRKRGESGGRVVIDTPQIMHRYREMNGTWRVALSP
jgi:hypothetical protein